MKQERDNLECSRILVMLGADFDKRLEFAPPSRSCAANDPVQAYHALGLNGKSVKEMALIAGNKALLDAIGLMEDSSFADSAWCRCGSRLPWNECHASPGVTGQAPHYTKGDNKQKTAGKKTKKAVYQYRYSPMAPCSCKVSKKAHFDCCWFSARPAYQNDANGELTGTVRINSNSPGGDEAIDAFLRLRAAAQDESGNVDLNAPLSPGNPAEHKRDTIQMLRGRAGPLALHKLATMSGVKSRIGEWDPIVYAGIIERIDRWFMWSDIHWNVDEPELLERVKEWNKALDGYCNSIHLTGQERERVVRQHTASPLGPCGNPSCELWETSVKQFLRCALLEMQKYLVLLSWVPAKSLEKAQASVRALIQ